MIAGVVKVVEARAMTDRIDDTGDSLFQAETTVPSDFQISLRGFADHDEAQAFGEMLGDVLRVIGRAMDISRLDGVTVAFNYDEALAQLDRGLEGLRPLERTNGEHVVGVAMTPTVLREGIVKGHLVFHAPAISGVSDLHGEGGRQALYLIAHECGHLADLKECDEAWPGVILRQPVTGWDAFLQPEAQALWEEYSASRRSAVFGGDEITESYRTAFQSLLACAADDVVASVKAYREHADIPCLLRQAGEPIAQALRAAVYLAGHLDGMGHSSMAIWDEEPAVSSRYRSSIQRLILAVRGMWDSRGAWPGLQVFEPLREVIRCALAKHGIFIRHLEDGGLYVDVPYNPETMP